MASYEVTIHEPVAPVEEERPPPPMVRTLDWSGDADSEEAAREAAWQAWDQQYSDERARPQQADVKVTKISE